jgi:carboxyl-terminal processing protease
LVLNEYAGNILNSMKSKFFLFFIQIVFLISCVNDDARFSKKLIKEFKEKSINKNNIDWVNFEKRLLQSFKISRDSAIITALTLNNNEHSYYYIPGKKLITGNYKKPEVLDSCNIFGALKRDKYVDIGYLKIRSFYGNTTNRLESKEESIKYINEILDSIKNQDMKPLKGWVIDLRFNYGGDMWPMLIALSPFFKDGKLGFFKSDGIEKFWKKETDEIFIDNKSQNDRVFGSKIKYRVKNRNVKISVLINRNTQSAGEATAIALMSLKNVMFFGGKTRGFATSNLPINMGNDEVLVLTTGAMHDVYGNLYPEGIKPDHKACDLKELDYLLTNRFYNKH